MNRQSLTVNTLNGGIVKKEGQHELTGVTFAATHEYRSHGIVQPPLPCVLQCSVKSEL